MQRSWNKEMFAHHKVLNLNNENLFVGIKRFFPNEECTAYFGAVILQPRSYTGYKRYDYHFRIGMKFYMRIINERDFLFSSFNQQLLLRSFHISSK